MHRTFVIFGCICGAFLVTILVTSPDTRSSQPAWVNSPLDLSATTRQGCWPPTEKKVRCIPI